MKFKKMLAIFLSAALFVTAFAGCGKKKADGITVQIGPNPETLDPALNSAVDGGNMLITLFETLLIIDQDNKVQPGQAEKYEVSPDGLTWTFTMRDGLKWSDGSGLRHHSRAGQSAENQENARGRPAPPRLRTHSPPRPGSGRSGGAAPEPSAGSG